MGSTTNPVSAVAQSLNSAQGANNSSSADAATPGKVLNANSFISLLTAELQAQDPTNPMNPEDMMNQMVSMNSLQTLLNIQQILSTATGVLPGSSTAGNGANGTSGASGSGQNTNAAQAAYTTARAAIGPSAATHDAIFQSKFPASAPVNQ